MVRILLLVVTTALFGCATAAPTRQTIDVVGPDWSMEVGFVAARNTCSLNGATLTNRASRERPTGVWFVTVVSSSNQTLGEAIFSCPTTVPGGSALCDTTARLFWPCQPTTVHVRGR